MRWPFTNLFRGAAARDDASSAGSETAPPDADGPAGPGPASVSRPGAWRELPPVQRAVGATPVTAPSTAFARGLAGRRVPDPMLAPLAHDMMADGPAGLVSGLAVPLVPRTSSVSDPRSAADLPAPADRMRPRVRGTVSTAAARPRLADREDAAADTTHEGAAAVPGDMATPEMPESGLPTIAQRVLPVARMAASGPAAPAPAIAATRVGEATAPAPIVARAVPLVPATARSAIAPGAAERPAATNAPDGTGLASGPVGERAVDAAQVLADGADRGLIIGRRTLGESRRLGLGAPLAGIPPTAARTKGRADLPVARLASPSSAPPDPVSVAQAVPRPVAAAAATQVPLPRLVVARGPSVVSGSGSAAGPAGPGRLAELPLVPHSGAAADREPAGAADHTTEATRSDPAQAEPADGGSSGPARPLVGEQPIAVSDLVPGDAHANADADGGAFGTLPLQRAAAPRPPTDVSDDRHDTDREGASAEVRPADVGPLQRGPASDAAASPSQTAGAQRALRGAPATAPLVAGRSARPGVSLPVSSLARATPADPASVTSRLAIPVSPALGGGQERVPAAAQDMARPAPSAARAASLQREERTTAARATTLAGRGSGSAAATALPLMRSSATAAAVAPATFPAAASDDAVGWSAATGFTSVAAQPGPFIQRAVQIDELTVRPAGDGAGGAAPAPAGSAAGQSGSGAGGAEGTDYEELAEQVYDKIRARLMTELLLDRERAGILVDW